MDKIQFDRIDDAILRALQNNARIVLQRTKDGVIDSVKLNFVHHKPYLIRWNHNTSNHKL